MKILFKILFWFVVFVLLLIGAIFYFLSSESLLNSGVKTAIDQSGLNIKFDKIEGDLFSGIAIKNFNYEDKVSGDVRIESDFEALKDGRVIIEDLNISNLKIDKDFLASLTTPSDEPKKEDNSSLDLSMIKEVAINSLHVDTKDIIYDQYKINSLNLDLKDVSYDMKDQIKANLSLDLDSNVTEASLKADIKDQNYNLSLQATPQKEFVMSFLKDQNITFENMPYVDLYAKGNFDEVDINGTITKTALKFQDIDIAIKSLDLKAKHGLKSGDLDSDLNIDIESSLASLKLKTDALLNINDLNNTLDFHLSSVIDPKPKGLSRYLKDQNLTINKTPQITLNANGNMDIIHAKIDLSDGDITYNEFEIFPKSTHIKSIFSPKKEDLSLKLNSDIDSNVANIDITSDVKLNLKDINNTLKYQLDTSVLAIDDYLQKILVEHNVTMDRLSPLNLHVKGDGKKLQALFDLDGSLRYDNILIEPTIKNSVVNYNLVKNSINSNLDIDINSNIAKVQMDSKVKLDLDDINNTLFYDTNLSILDVQKFQDIDLREIGDMRVKLLGTLKNLDASIKSKKLNLLASSEDFDKFDVKLNSKKIYIGKIYKDLPPELKKSFIALNLDGFYKLKSSKALFEGKIDGFKYDKNIISTDKFIFKLDNENFSIKDFVLKSGKFRLKIDALKNDQEIIANIKNRAFSADAKIKLEPLWVDIDSKIDSIDRLIKEINMVYPLKIDQKIDGKILLKAKTNRSNKIKFSLSSNEIKLESGKIDKLLILGFYDKNRVILKNFDIFTKDFEEKILNRKIELSKDAVIKFNDQNMSADIELKNLLKIKAKKIGENLNADLDIKKLPLSYTGYGKTVLSTTLRVEQAKQKTLIAGEVHFRDTEINYESAYLSPSSDSDIIILTKESKSKAKKKQEPSFMDNLTLNVAIIPHEILYKVSDGEIKLEPDMLILKDEGDKGIKLAGRIKIIEGEYDFADKRFKLDEGFIAFRAQQDINPLLDLHVTYDEIEDILIKIAISGDKNRPKLTFTSDPIMSKKDIFSYLLFGFAASETEGAASSANNAAERIFGRAIAKDLARELHLDRLDMSRNNLGGIDVKAGKKITKKDILYYQNKSTESSFILEHKISKHWEFSTEVGKQGQGVDLIFRKGFK